MRKLLRVAAIAVIALCAFATWVLYPPPAQNITFPDGKRFAFSIVDDTDMATLERARPLYDLLNRYGLRTTKTVWVLEARDPSHAPNQGHTLRDPEYRAFIEELREHGFEIALHGVRGGSSERTDIVTALEEFKREVGGYPKLHVNHSLNRDNVYWGEHRWSFMPYRWLYAIFGSGEFLGHDPASAYFWGDLVRQHVEYVNQFTFSEINLLRVTPSFPYHLPDKPYVNFWFPTANGNNLDDFERLLSTENLDRLEREGGVCLVFTHLASGSFNEHENGGVNARFEARIRDLASRNGWFAPASEILDHLKRQPGWRKEPGWRESVRLETVFLWDVITG